MNCRGCRQRFLPLPDLSRKIEGDSVHRVTMLKKTRGNFWLKQFSFSTLNLYGLPYTGSSRKPTVYKPPASI